MSKSHPYIVENVAALKAAYPQLVTERTEVVQDVDHAKLYQLVKVKTLLGEPMPAGVTLKAKKGAAGTEGESAEAAPAAEEIPLHIAQLGVTQVQ